MERILNRIRHAISWRRERLAYEVGIRLALASLALRERLGQKQKPHNFGGELIVSLTSYPPRYGTLSLTLRSLLRQTMRVDRVILWIAHDDLQKLPGDVLRLQSQRLEIRGTDDLKSYTKILPTLDAFPQAHIATADDDVYYWPSWLEELVQGLNADGKTAACHRVHGIETNADGSYKPYGEWALEVSERTVSARFFPTGVGGILYPPGALVHTKEDRAIIATHCPKGDDLWLYWIGRRNGMRYRTVGKHRKLILWRGSQENCLWHENLLQGYNDQQIRMLAELYGYPGIN